MTEMRQVAGVHHRRVGDIAVTALNDGHQDVSMATVLGIAPGEAAAMLRAAFRPVPRRTAVNAFLFEATGTNVRLLPAIGVVADQTLHPEEAAGRDPR